MTISIPNNRPYVEFNNDRNINNSVSIISHYLFEFLNLYKKSGLNNRNEPEYELIENVPCRFVQKPNKITDDSGNIVICSGIIYLNLEPEINLPNDYIIFNGVRYDPVKRHIMKHFIESHQELYIL